MRGRGCAPPRCAVRGARSPASRWSRCNHIPRQLCTRGRSGQSTRIITKFLGRIPTALGPGVVAQAEEALAGYAMTMAPEQLEAVGHRILAHLNSDGNLTDDADRQRRRGLGMGREGVDLMSELTATLTPACRAKLDAVFAKLACPGAATGPEAGGPADAETVRSEPGAAAVAADTRSQHQRNHDALEALCDLVLGGPRLGSHRGMPVTAIVTMTLIDLERGIGQATTASGGTLPIRDALRMAEHAHPVLVLFDHDGRPLHLGRERRLASADQRLALIAAERGCSKPGCMAPADQCQVHHTEEWERGGRKDIDKLTLGCTGDHAQVNPGPNGWATAIGADPDYPGACAWAAPAHVDPQQIPRTNHTHHVEELLRPGRPRNGVRERDGEGTRGEPR